MTPLGRPQRWGEPLGRAQRKIPPIAPELWRGGRGRIFPVLPERHQRVGFLNEIASNLLPAAIPVALLPQVWTAGRFKGLCFHHAGE
jgi:hypothetical protein